MVFMVIPFSVVLQEAVMTRELSASQLISALCADLDIEAMLALVCGVSFPFRDQSTGATLQRQVSVVRNQCIVPH